MPNTNDPLREEILKFVYDVHRRTVPSENGQVTGAVFASEVRKRCGADRREIAANIDYLVGTGHIQHILQPIVHEGQTLPGIGRHYYRITSKGIDSLENPSSYMNKPDAPNIAITTQSGFTIVGNNNTVSVGTADLPSLLRELAALIQASHSITPEVKVDTTADIQTIEMQLKKSKPNREILQTAWKGIEGVVTAAEFTAIATKIAEFLGSLA
ncbi:hypothetical protein [Rhodoferax sp.]|uniref:hypothetical protein n=1 Tax=Rhodoferax sp. TaxID=50421 RepID=UPI00272594AB|nr:hypothetical protein [Rhodoferax sp.]MDO8319716.1 hypothetical protein [Rhodoferax sp.]